MDDCTCDDAYTCDRPECAAKRDEEAARWYALFESTPDPIAYTDEDLRADGVYDDQPYKYADIDL